MHHFIVILHQIDAWKPMLLPIQIRAARALLNWSANDLAKQAGLHLTTVQRVELMNGPFRGNTDTLRKLETALIDAGVEFIEDPDRPGVCLVIERVNG